LALYNRGQYTESVEYFGAPGDRQGAKGESPTQ
jgi:hypothetical protein